MQYDIANGERELRKRLDVVHRVFKQASQRLNRIDRNWQEVIDATVYIIEEVKNEAPAADNFQNVRRDKQ